MADEPSITSGIDFSSLSVDEVITLRQTAAAEEERRRVLTSTPDQVQHFTSLFLDAGGDPQAIHDAVDKAALAATPPQDNSTKGELSA